MTGAHLLDERRQFAEIVTVVRVTKNQVASAGGFDATAEGIAIAALGNGDDARTVILGDFLRAVGRAVVRDDDLPTGVEGEEGLPGLIDTNRQGASLVEARHYDADLDVVCPGFGSCRIHVLTISLTV